MPIIETPSGLVKVGGTKTFSQVQTENQAIREDLGIKFSPCGIPLDVADMKNQPQPDIILED
jgi:hypothetical protein